MNDQSIINRISRNEINLSDIEDLINEYYNKEKYLIKFFLLRFAKEICPLIVKYIIDNDDHDIIEYLLGFHDLKICNINKLDDVCKKYEICVNICKCESTLYWHYLYKEMLRICDSTPRLLVKNEGFESNLSSLITMTDVYDNRLDKIIKDLFELGYYNFIIQFIMKNRLFSNFYHKLLITLENEFYEKKINIDHKYLLQTIEKMDDVHSRYTYLTKHLIISDLRGTSNMCVLRSSKVKHIVSLTRRKFFKAYFINYIRIPIEDKESEEFIENCLDVAKDMIHKIRNKETILIHCVKGLSRSVCFAILILMLLGNDYNESYKFIKSKKNINPNPKFLRELEQLKL